MTQDNSTSLDSFNCRDTLTVGGETFEYFNLKTAEANGLEGISRLPYSLKVLLENLLRFEDGTSVTKADIEAMAKWLDTKKSTHEIAYRPARVLMQDFTGVPAVVDLAAMRDAMANMGGDPNKINPQVPVDLVIDHSVMVDRFGTADSFAFNVEREYERNMERYKFLKWGAGAFENFRVVPPGTGICHQVNLEYLASTVGTKTLPGGTKQAFPDTCVGTDSHTTMINGLSVLGWGVGGIEAEAAMLGQPVSMLIPEVIGFELKGKLNEGVTATDLVLTVVEILRAKGVVAKFVEFYGDGLDTLSLEDEATISNMAPEYGATCGFFPIDGDTLKYLTSTGRADDAKLSEAYAKAQGMMREPGHAPEFTDVVTLDMADVQPSISGPKRPQDRIALTGATSSFAESLGSEFGKSEGTDKTFNVEGEDYELNHGNVVLAAITSCTNTSNPSVLVGAGLVARKARAKGLNVKPWVKTSFAPGSQVVTDYLEKSGLQDDLDALGFDLVGYGCTTCIGNSGPLPAPVSKTINDNDMVVAGVLSGNRNFEGRISPDIKANYLASPPLVVAYAILGTMNIDITTQSIGDDKDGNPVFLKDIWPTTKEIADIIRETVSAEIFAARYGDVFKGDDKWQAVETSEGTTYAWDNTSTYIQNPPYFEDIQMQPGDLTDVHDARIMGLFLDSITTDHISPAGAIKADSPAGKYLSDNDVPVLEFNSYGSRRGNHEVMMRGTFANIRIKNQMVPGTEGGVTLHQPDGEQMPIYDAAMKYRDEGTPLVVFAGKEYGTGSSRDWAAKGTTLLGVRAVIAQSYERIHRSNLIGMGVLPLVINDGTSWSDHGITGKETVTIKGIADLTPGAKLTANVTFEDGSTKDISVLCRIDTEDELAYYRNGGILHYVLRNLASAT